ncbi:lytic murein transglycosylase B [Roseateles amylovorans]|uniref:Lytic murein transglycosylase B n=1 Tax=Roseateles amylovorans TaxID=2978473 RepID=A0ABY6B409_9BURK|nr:lytic murein transglycosylase B [Roseateles amylovorans]UXH80113.1 lytic murein transglycosylase B [Roseateles amylovorans]
MTASRRRLLLTTSMTALAPALATLAALAMPLPALAVEAGHKKPLKLNSGAKPKVPPAASPAFGERADLMQFADREAAALGYEPGALRALLAQARLQASVQRLILPGAPGQAKDWGAYRQRFIEPRRLQAGLGFWADNEAALAKAEATYGVPAEIIASIIGIETFYGRIMGGYRVLDALTTLGFDYPNPLPPGARDRSEYFRDELRQFLILSRENGLDPLAMKGSYAGAMGWGQFMPGSWRRFAIDFDGDGHVDLINSQVDAIGSVANFLKAHGWQRGLPTHYEVQPPVDTAAKAQLLLSDVLPQLDVNQFLAAGADLSIAGLGHVGPLALIELQMGGAAPVYVAGTKNFYTVTRYNQSSYYAMAVIEFANTLASWRRAGTSQRSDSGAPATADAPVKATASTAASGAFAASAPSDEGGR